MKYWIYLLLLTPLTLFSESNERVLIRLSHDYPLIQIYIAPTKTDLSLDPALIENLEEALFFDFEENGMTHISPQTAALDKAALNLTPENRDKLANAGNEYLLSLTIQEKQLTLKSTSLATGDEKITPAIAVPSDTLSARRVVHKIADTLFNSLFQTKGIAQERFIFIEEAQKRWMIKEMDWDGQGERLIFTSDTIIATPAYLPAVGGGLPGYCYCVNYGTGQPKVVYLPLKGGTPQKMITLRGNQLTPTVSQQRDQIAFISDAAGNPDLFIQPIDPVNCLPQDKPRQIFSKRLATQASPTFSPDGKKIAFVSDKDGSPRVFMMDIPDAGANITQLKPKLISTRCRESSAPSWSPDGKKIAYTAKSSDGIRQIWIYDLEKREERQITKGALNKENPKWAPNSLHIIYNTVENENASICMTNLHTGRSTTLTPKTKSCRYPAWR